MKDVIALTAGYVFIVIQAILGDVLGRESLTPSLLLAFVLFLGAIDFGSARGTAISFVLGYLLDLSSGSPSGVHSFVIPATYLVFRAVYSRMMFSGVIFQIVLTFIASVATGMLIIGLRTLFERSIFMWNVIPGMVLIHSLSTALVAPIVFKIGKILIPESPKKKEEKVVL
jgi:rod shape-determining protein MreD